MEAHRPIAGIDDVVQRAGRDDDAALVRNGRPHAIDLNFAATLIDSEELIMIGVDFGADMLAWRDRH